MMSTPLINTGQPTGHIHLRPTQTAKQANKHKIGAWQGAWATPNIFSGCVTASPSKSVLGRVHGPPPTYIFPGCVVASSSKWATVTHCMR